jgi:hypothetical protein
MLEAKARGCFGREYTITFKGRPLGRFHSKWFSESLSIHLLGRRDLELRKQSMFGSQFALIDTENGTQLGSAKKAGLFSRKWKLQLSIGEATLVPTFWYSHHFKIILAGQEIGHTRKHWLYNRWKVASDRDIPIVDQLLLGLIFQIVIDRQAAANN